MKRKIVLAISVLSMTVAFWCACDNNSTQNPSENPHTHTFAETYSMDETYHWYSATCEHTNETKEKAEHNFDEGILQENGKTLYTCSVCSYQKELDSENGEESGEEQAHTHTFAQTYTTNETHHWYSATCGHTNETKDKGEHDFDEGQENASRDFVYTCETCNYEKVIDHSERVFDVVDVDDFKENTQIIVEGYYVGVTEDGAYAKKEVLIKDLSNDSLVSIRKVPMDDDFDCEYEVGDKLRVYVTVKKSNRLSTANKKYLEYSNKNVSVAGTIISRGNDVSFDLDSAVEISSWDEMQSAFKVGEIQNYTYLKISGALYMNEYTDKDGEIIYRTHMNESATTAKEMFTDEKRSISLRDNVMSKNLGENWEQKFFARSTSTLPGVRAMRTIYAVYTGGNDNYFQLTLLDDNWVQSYEYKQGDILKEVAYAFKNQESMQIQYDQLRDRRHLNPSPEDATAQHTLYLDCSSYVNAIYYEAFGENILPCSVTSWYPNTRYFTAYARDYRDNVDVVGYWETDDYTTDAEKEALLQSVLENMQVGDILNYRHAAASTQDEVNRKGHVYMYMGNNKFIHRPGAGDYVYNESDPGLSYDKENTKVIEILDASVLFEDTTHTRYLFKSTTSDKVFNFCVLRPLARGMTATQEALNRMDIAGLVMEKTSSVFENNAVCTNDTITYTITMKNTGATLLQNVVISDVLPTGTEYVASSGTNGVEVNGQNLTWIGDVAGNSTVTVTYQVKVITTVAGTKLESNQTTVGGVKLGNIRHTVSGYSATQLETVADTAKAFATQARTFDSPIEFVKTLYSEALGESIFDYTTMAGILADLLDVENKTCRTDTDVSKMLVPDLYGGMDVRRGYHTRVDVARTRIVDESELAIGDIIIAEWGGGEIAYVYAGNKTLIRVSQATKTCTALTIDDDVFASGKNHLISLIAYDGFAVLRPSMVATTD